MERSGAEFGLLKGVKMKILIVDDDRGTLNALKAGLISHGHRVLVADDGPLALRIIEVSYEGGDPVDLVVSDLRMPEMNGLELIQASRRICPQTAHILMTAYGGGDVKTAAENIERCAYIEKPFNPERLLEMIGAF
jgi:DNA-binding NtrC family response regulator